MFQCHGFWHPAMLRAFFFFVFIDFYCQGKRQNHHFSRDNYRLKKKNFPEQGPFIILLSHHVTVSQVIVTPP
jgi:hypothetical protein